MADRLKRHWDEWFTFLSYPEVKPDNNDAERALRPIVVHRRLAEDGKRLVVLVVPK